MNDPSDNVNDLNNLIGASEVIEHPGNASDVRFYLYTSKDREFTNHSVDPNHPTKLIQAKDKIYFLIHGWLQSPATTPWFDPLTEILLKKFPDAYIVQTDWSKLTGGNYSSAAYASEGVGKTLGSFICKLIKDYNVSSKKIVLIGHSLGGPVASWACKRYTEVLRSKLPRIIALDPSGPLFNYLPNSKKLNKNDALVVMVVHTDKTKLGYFGKCGTIDFFPNGGTDQPGCSFTKDSHLCNHNRAYKIFLEAVQSPQLFIARKCLNYYDFKNNKCENIEASLGDLETSQTGSFYLVTGDKSPFFNIQ